LFRTVFRTVIPVVTPRTQQKVLSRRKYNEDVDWGCWDKSEREELTLG